MGNRIVITVDGLAGTGKTTLSKQLAGRLGFVHLSTGILYRSVGFLALREGIDPGDEKAVSELVGKHSIELALGEGDSARVLIDGTDVMSELYVPEVSEATSKAAQYRGVRLALVDTQRAAFPGRNLVAEGRDMGSVIFPDAEVKFFVHTDEEVKVERRIKQLSETASDTSPEALDTLREKMKIEIHERDVRDAERALSPATQTEDMIFVDNSSEPLEKVLEGMHRAVVSGASL